MGSEQFWVRDRASNDQLELIDRGLGEIAKICPIQVDYVPIEVAGWAGKVGQDGILSYRISAR
jgi:hypothetical protein